MKKSETIPNEFIEVTQSCIEAAAEKAKYPFDGHTPQDVIERLKAL